MPGRLSVSYRPPRTIRLNRNRRVAGSARCQHTARKHSASPCVCDRQCCNPLLHHLCHQWMQPEGGRHQDSERPDDSAPPPPPAAECPRSNAAPAARNTGTRRPSSPHAPRSAQKPSRSMAPPTPCAQARRSHTRCSRRSSAPRRAAARCSPHAATHDRQESRRAVVVSLP